MGCEFGFNNKLRDGGDPSETGDEGDFRTFMKEYGDVIRAHKYTKEMLESGDGAPKIVYKDCILRCLGYHNTGCLECPHDFSC